MVRPSLPESVMPPLVRPGLPRSVRGMRALSFEDCKAVLSAARSMGAQSKAVGETSFCPVILGVPEAITLWPGPATSSRSMAHETSLLRTPLNAAQTRGNSTRRLSVRRSWNSARRFAGSARHRGVAHHLVLEEANRGLERMRHAAQPLGNLRELA